jgi:calcineurin-like phosphoesterase family protein
MNIWIITDFHLGNRQFSEEGLRPADFSERLIKNLGRCPLTRDSVLLNLGDVCMDDDSDWNRLLTGCVSGRKWLVLGNHDRKSASWYLSQGWDWVGESFSLTAFGRKILFSHKPEPLPPGYGLNIHGHFHNFSLEKIKAEEPELFRLMDPQHFLVAMENLNYQPVRLERVIQMVRYRSREDGRFEFREENE